jgi:catechol 2,3-dioxygenase
MAEVATEVELQDPNGKRILRPTLHHTGNYTTRVDEMLEWYRIVLGMEVVVSAEPFEAHWCTNDHAHHRTSFARVPGMRSEAVRDCACVNHQAFEYASVDDLLESWARLGDLGIVPHTTVDHGPTFAFYYWDPDGNNVELLADAYGDHERSMEAMRSRELARNPMGFNVDPALLLEARSQGMPLDELHERAMRGEFGTEWKPVAGDHVVADAMLDEA